MTPASSARCYASGPEVFVLYIYKRTFKKYVLLYTPFFTSIVTCISSPTRWKRALPSRMIGARLSSESLVWIETGVTSPLSRRKSWSGTGWEVDLPASLSLRRSRERRGLCSPSAPSALFWLLALDL